MNAPRIEGKVALVTGAHRGIGLALTRALLDRGAAKVYATARDLLTLPRLYRKYGDAFVGVQLDLTEPDRIAEVAALAADVQILFNNAGVAIGEDLCPDAAFADARYEMEVNYFGPLQLLTRLAPTLASNGGGAVVNISSVAGLTSFSYFPTYSASKAALHSLTQAARVRLANQDIGVFGVYLGSSEAEAAADPLLRRASPTKTAEAILDDLERGREDIFPDERAICFAERYLGSPKESEREAAARVVKQQVVN